ncbi:hypothetical protein Lal_00013786 [Lupinus albus]|nr:hypothetical protein Lal_00013786 [Lupinus albus]
MKSRRRLLKLLGTDPQRSPRMDMNNEKDDASNERDDYIQERIKINEKISRGEFWVVTRDNKIDVDMIHKMGLFRDLNDIVYKHRSDRPATPIDPLPKYLLIHLHHKLLPFNPNHLHLLRYLQIR